MPLDRTQQERERQLETELRRQAAEYGRLAPEEEAGLLSRLPDAEAARSLVEHNLDLVVQQAESHLGRGLLFSDLYQEGTLGLVDAVSAFTSTGAFGDGQGEFRQVANLHIGLQMDSLIEAEGSAIKESDQDVLDVRTLDMAQAMFRRDNRREATPEEMMKALTWDEEHLARIDKILDLAREHNDAATISFLDPSDAEELGIDFVTDEDAPDPRRRPQGAGPDD